LVVGFERGDADGEGWENISEKVYVEGECFILGEG